eukprot:2604873-Amphidinium_carterae.1
MVAEVSDSDEVVAAALRAMKELPDPRSLIGDRWISFLRSPSHKVQKGLLTTAMISASIHLAEVPGCSSVCQKLNCDDHWISHLLLSIIHSLMFLLRLAPEYEDVSLVPTYAVVDHHS